MVETDGGNSIVTIEVPLKALTPITDKFIGIISSSIEEHPLKALSPIFVIESDIT